MSEFDEGAPKKKSSWVMTCGILFVVFGLGFLAVAGIGGYYAYTAWYMPQQQPMVAGLLSIVNSSADPAKVTCTGGDGWTAEKEIAPGETAQVEISPRPSACSVTYGAQTMAWSIVDPPASDETWTLTLAAAEAPPAVARTLTVHNRTGSQAHLACTDATGWTEAKDVFNGADVDVSVPSRPATCAITSGTATQTWMVGAAEAPEDLWAVYLVSTSGGFAISATEAAAADATTPPVDATAGTAGTTTGTTGTTASTTTGATGSTASTGTTTSSSKSSTGSTSTASKSTTSSSGSTSTASKSGTGGSSRSGSTTGTSTTATTTPTTTTTTSTGSGGTTRTPPPPPEEEEDEDLPDSSVLTAVKVEWAKGAKKSTSYTVALDGKKVGPIPTKSLVSSGVHKVKLTASGADPFECTITASGGEDIYFYFDPDNRKCPK